MAAPAAAEVTIIIVDTSRYLEKEKDHPFIKAQIEAIKHYSTVKLKCNPDSRVGLFRMSLYDYGYLLPPTRDLGLIFRFVESLLYHVGGPVMFMDALHETMTYIKTFHELMKMRLLVFVGSPIYLRNIDVEPLGLMLKGKDIALDVVNFSVSKEASLYMDDKCGGNRCSREELVALVNVVNDTGNSHFVEVDVDKSSVCDLLSKFILKKNLKYLRVKNARKAKTNVNLKQKLGQNEKNKSAGEYGKELPPLEIIYTENSQKIDIICDRIWFALSNRACSFYMHDEKSGKFIKGVCVEQDLEHLSEDEDY